MKALVSVIIPVKNRSEELKRAIRSVLAQSHQSFEILVIDDQSEEDIQTVVAEFNEERIHYFLNTLNVSNANVCRNIGLKHAKGEFVAMLDSDDEWLPEHLALKLQFIKNHSCDGVFGSAYVDNGETRTLRLSRPRGQKELMLDYLLTTGKAPTPTHFYKTSCAQAIGWDEELLRHQDYDFSARFAEKFSFLPSEDATVIINWKMGDKRMEDIASQIKFLQKHDKNISPNVKVKYLTETYSRIANRVNLPKEERSFFLDQSLNNIRFMSLADFCLLKSHKSSRDKVLNRFEFACRVIFL
jgi:glycosyltransferase involved in cell wall biosynthesis